MRKRLLGSVAALAAGAGLAFGAGARATAQTPVVEPTPSAIVQPAGPVVGGPATSLPAGNLPTGIMPGPVFPGDGTAPPGFDPRGGLFGQPGGGDFKLERIWTSWEYLLWDVHDGPVSTPLAVHGTVGGGADPTLPGAVTLFREPIAWDWLNGARITVGAFLPGSTRVGVEASGQILEIKPLTRAFDSGNLGIPVLGTPYINELTGDIDSLLAAGPGSPGRILTSAKTQMYTVDMNMVGSLYRRLYFHANVLAGFRHFALQEEIYTQFNSVGNPNGTFLGVANTGPIALEDRFATGNWFYGGQLGFQFQYRYRRLVADYQTIFAMGVMNRVIRVNGFTDANVGGNRVRAAGGLFATTTNMGERYDNEFGVVPQLTARLGYQCSPCLRLTAGIDFLYAASVVRPGDQIDPVVNPTVVPLDPLFGQALGTARPSPRFINNDFWAFGLSFGFHLRF